MAEPIKMDALLDMTDKEFAQEVYRLSHGPELTLAQTWLLMGLAIARLLKVGEPDGKALQD